MASHLQSPIFRPNPFPLESNDDQLERTAVRAARAASIRRKFTAFSPPPPSILPRRSCLDNDQIMDLFQNCIKLATENKINQKNMWELGLIDHLSEIVRFRSEGDDNETNFQKASCSLEAGVKIYSLRVDSVHSEAYKVLGGINRAGREQNEENVGDGAHTQTKRAEGLDKKDLDKKLSPLCTLESSYEALNVKKFDVAFTVDPLYHQTSAQFDEGGAKGLLLNNLGVYGGCRVLFDSFESPEKNILSEPQMHDAEVIDLSFAKEIIDQMMACAPVKNDISPTLKEILGRFDEDNHRTPDVLAQQPIFQENTNNNGHFDVEGNAYDDCASSNFDHSDYASFGHEDRDANFSSTYANITSHPDENDEYTINDPKRDRKLEKITELLSMGLGFTSRSNAWAGPDHWKYHKAKGSEQISCSDNETELASKKRRIKKGVPDLDFTKSLDKEMPSIFAPPKNPKSLLLPGNRAPFNITLPEDRHYRPESLVKLFVLPDVMCLGKKQRTSWASDESRKDNGSWDDEDIGNDPSDIPTYSSDTEDPGTLVRPPRQVNKADIQYDKVSKQVDVHALKDMLWSNIQGSVQTSDEKSEATVSLRQVLHRSSDSCLIASLSKEISPHLYFICLLHLANEHGLSLHDCPTLDELDICIPSSAFVNEHQHSSYV